LGKGPKLVKCWGCEGNHLHRDYPYKGERMRTFHKIQEAKTVEYMEGNIPRIYAILENKQARSQSPILK
jgi:hypothetical protein